MKLKFYLLNVWMLAIALLTTFDRAAAQVNMDVCVRVSNDSLVFAYKANGYDYVNPPENFWNNQLLTVRYPTSVSLTFGGISAQTALGPWESDGFTPGAGANGGDGFFYKTFLAPATYTQDFADGVLTTVFKVKFTTSASVTFQTVGSTNAWAISNNKIPAVNHAIYDNTFSQFITSCGSLTYGANQAPNITNASGAPTNTVSFAENATGTVIDYDATDLDIPAQTLTYSLSGTDAAAFTINPTTGVLTFNAAPNFEVKNSYAVTVTVSDGAGGSDTQDLTVNITDVDEDGDGFTSANGETNDANPCMPSITAGPCDQDNDGLTNAQEATAGTSPTVVDTDGDGQNDGAELPSVAPPTDTDGDGTNDALESGIVDTDGDGVMNELDPNNTNPCMPSTSSSACDQDNDGLTNAQETTAGTNPTVADTDGDGQNDGAELPSLAPPTDTDGDGTNDAIESGITDTDGDGVVNELDPNNANGCIPNNNSPTCGNDDDGDGTPNSTDPDDVNPCVPSVSAGPCDQDSDGLTNTQEASAGTNPAVADTDGDGQNDGAELPTLAPPTDTDGDGINDANESGIVDTDGDGVMNELDPNNTNPCIPATSAGACDQDMDGLTNAQETTAGTNPTLADTDGDGQNDGTELPSLAPPTDTDGDGTNDANESDDTDTDGDGIVNELDPSNADPCSPSIAAGPCDLDGDGTPNSTDPDDDGDGINDVVDTKPFDTDNDGINNDTDPDDDNDGVADITDSAPINPCVPSTAAGPCDQDSDGLTNAQETTAGTNPAIADTDGDGQNDGAELPSLAPPTDTDGDGINDAIESGIVDTDGDGVMNEVDPNNTNPCIPSTAASACDQDNDGLTNGQEATAGTNPTNPDTDGDGQNDGAELPSLVPPTDTDGDGINDAIESSIVDTDGDGVPNETDPSNNNPCSPSIAAGPCDLDGDGLPNSTDPDDDGDGINDVVDTKPYDTDNDGINNDTDPDDDNDGVNDITDSAPLNPCVPSTGAGPCDQDTDGLTNAQEITAGTTPTVADTDGDGQNDGAELPSLVPPTDTDGDGINDALESGIVDTDGDGVMNETDPNNTNPCIPATTAAPCDQDNDGLTNAQEATFGTNPTVADTDGDGQNDGAEATTNTDGTEQNDALESSIVDSDGDGIMNENDPSNFDGCVPNTNSPTCGNDDDGDGTPNSTDPDDVNPCVPATSAGPCDQDSDGLTNAQEATAGTNPTVADTDGDGQNDGAELPTLVPPTDTDGDGINDAIEPSNVDTDGDGVMNEFDPNNTNPCMPSVTAGPCDQDNDGLTNAQEATAGTNPTNPDTDGDGQIDGAELPSLAPPTDTDGDGVNDANDSGTVDTDGDGIVNELDPTNNDPCSPSIAAGPCDLDGDGTPNSTDPDDDGDGINDVVDTKPYDTDNDGINNDTDPDDDNDGVADITDSAPLNPCVPSSGAGPCDQDSDGLTNAEEITAGTNPTVADTDGDGLNDGEEVTGVDDPATTIVAAAVSSPTDPCSPNPSAPACTQTATVLLSGKVFLQGAYDQSSGKMRDDLRAKGYLPAAQPYSAMARFSQHTGTEVKGANAFVANGDNSVVDWVMVELRDGSDATEIVASRAALVQKDGDIVDMDGISPLTFLHNSGSYFVAVNHRNHLGAMTSAPIALNGVTATPVDFTNLATGLYGTNPTKTIGTKRVLWGGNANNGNSVVFVGPNNDNARVKDDILLAGANASGDFSYIETGYRQGDTNLDGDVIYQGPSNDLDILIFFNVMLHPANSSTNPLFIIYQQIP